MRQYWVVVPELSGGKLFYRVDRCVYGTGVSVKETMDYFENKADANQLCDSENERFRQMRERCEHKCIKNRRSFINRITFGLLCQ